MGQFLAGMYLIMRAGEPVTVGRFSSTEDLLDQIGRLLPEGTYRIYRLSPLTSPSGPGSSYWGEVTNHGGGKVTAHPSAPESG
jgi:hypothetical protein